MKDETEKAPQAHHGHPHRSVGKHILVSLLILTILVAGTSLAILYGKGYRFFFQNSEPKLSKTGILHVTSLPTGAQVYVDGHLTTATDNSINLPPKKYTITIAKDGYRDWQKDFEVQKEVVLNADAVLYPKSPTLQSISTFGVDSVVVDPSGTKLAFKINSQSVKRNGIYVFDMTTRGFPVLAGQSSSTQVADDTAHLFSKAQISWSPDGKQLLASVSGTTATTYFLLKADELNDKPQDVTLTLKSVTDLWQIQRRDKETTRMKSLKSVVQKFTKQNFRIISWSPDERKILYQASESGQMPVFIKPRLIGNNQLYEQRTLQKGAIYVYDRKEDVNTRITEKAKDLCPEIDPKAEIAPVCMQPFTWLSDSKHLLYVHDKKIEIVEDDGSNMTTVYAGPFIGRYVFPWPDASKIVILTNLNNPDVSPTLYSIGLK